MRLRKKPRIETEILEHLDLVELNTAERHKGNWQKLFAQTQPLHLEIGTGRGSFIVGMAQQFPQYNFVGVEANIDVIYDVIQKIRNSPIPLNNIHLIRDDANLLEYWFDCDEVAQIYLNFSDPWPKVRHAKRRLTHIGFLNKYRNILQKNGTVRVKTDNDDLFAFTLEQIPLANGKLLTVCKDLYQTQLSNPVATEYEQKFVSLGKNINFCEFSL